MCRFLVMILLHQVSGFTNVALHKTASQIDTKYSANASLAIDGNTNQLFWEGNSCSLTQTNSSTYWYVDLGALYDIDHVNIFKRMDPCCSDRMRDVELHIGGTNTSYTMAAYQEGILDPVYTFQLNPVVRGRWVKLSKPGPTGYLSLCEVEVMVKFAESYDSFDKVHSQKGTGDVIKSIYVRSTLQCCFRCTENDDCVGVNIRHDSGETSVLCELLRDRSSVQNTDSGFDFYVAG